MTTSNSWSNPYSTRFQAKKSEAVSLERQVFHFLKDQIPQFSVTVMCCILGFYATFFDNLISNCLIIVKINYQDRQSY